MKIIAPTFAERVKAEINFRIALAKAPSRIVIVKQNKI